MTYERVTVPAFTVIGLEGSTAEDAGIVARLWQEANARFGEVAHLAKRREDGSFAGFWGAMSDLSRRFLPWEEHFTRGLYLAGVECPDDALPPPGWTKWRVPGFVCLRAEAEPGAFGQVLRQLEEQGMTLAGAVQDFTDPRTGKNWMLFPVERL